MKYRILQKGEIIQNGDQKDACINPWKDKPKWVDAVSDVGKLAPDPKYPAHTVYRRPVIDAQPNVIKKAKEVES